jgi:hypothetical protein
MRAAPALALLTALASSGLGAQDSGPLTVGGTVGEQPFLRYAISGSAEGSGLSYGSNSGLGLELGVAGAAARAAASVEAAVLTGAAAADAWSASAAGMESPDLLLVPSYAGGSPAPVALLAARVRALYVKLDFEKASLTAGRQVVNYRLGALWSPTDLFTELDLSGLSPVRRGSDALRLVFPLGATGALDLVAAPKADPSQGRYAARLSGLVAGVDASAIAYRDGANGLYCAGAGFKADLAAGIDGEALLSFPDAGPDPGKHLLRAALGADYSIGELIFAAEYYYDGGGAPDPASLGAHNAYASLAWKATDFVTLTGLAAADPASGAWSATLLAGLDAAQNAKATAYVKLLRTVSPAVYRSAEAGLSLTLSF